MWATALQWWGNGILDMHLGTTHQWDEALTALLATCRARSIMSPRSLEFQAQNLETAWIFGETAPRHGMLWATIPWIFTWLRLSGCWISEIQTSLFSSTLLTRRSTSLWKHLSSKNMQMLVKESLQQRTGTHSAA